MPVEYARTPEYVQKMENEIDQKFSETSELYAGNFMNVLTFSRLFSSFMNVWSIYTLLPHQELDLYDWH